MPIQSVRHPGPRSDRGRSDELWGNFPIETILAGNASYGFGIHFDFNEDEAADWTATQATAGTFANDATAGVEGGVALADSASTTATQGINCQYTHFRCIPEANTVIIGEGRLKFADVATGPEFFFGLAEVDTSIIASSALSTANHVGVSSVTDDNIIIEAAEKAGAAHTSGGTVHTAVDGTYFKAGFRISGVTKIEFYINGAKVLTADVATANIPVVALVPSLVCQTGGTTDPIVHIDWCTFAKWDQTLGA